MARGLPNSPGSLTIFAAILRVIVPSVTALRIETIYLYRRELAQAS
jgi:hypothetical protein